MSRTMNVTDDLLPLCAVCRQVRDEAGCWHDIDDAIYSQPGVGFTHTVCPECARRIYPEMYIKMYDEQRDTSSDCGDAALQEREHAA